MSPITEATDRDELELVLVIAPKAVVGGFSWQYTKILTDELERISFFPPSKEYSEEFMNPHTNRLTIFAEVLVESLRKQLSIEKCESITDDIQVEELVQSAKKFLAIFEKK